MTKPTWDEYFIDMTYYIAQRSIDPSTKCGCVVVSEDNSVLSVGYNSPPRDCIDEEIPLTRPEKYDYIVHAEENAILNAARHGIPLKGSTFYVTGTPCIRCFRGILNVGARKVVHGPNCAKMHTSEHEVVKDKMNIRLVHNLPTKKVEIVEFKGRVGKVLFETTREYMKNKFGNCIIDTEQEFVINHKE